MKPLIVLVLGACLGAAAPPDSQLLKVHKVYLMPMGGGLDQYLAERITREGLFTVVVDPKQADAVLSERVDPTFEAAMKGLSVWSPEAPKKSGETDQKDQPPRRSLGRARGNVFLVAVGSRQVVWSTHLKMEDRSPEGLHRAARGVVKSLKKDLEGKQKD